jgi:hypothetical protein
MYTRQKSAVLPEQIFVIVMTERNETLTRSGEICLGLIPIQPEVSYPATKQPHRKHIKTTLQSHHKLSANKIDDPTKIGKECFFDYVSRKCETLYTSSSARAEKKV